MYICCTILYARIHNIYSTVDQYNLIICEYYTYITLFVFIDPCPGNFTRIAHACYHFSERQYNWKSAMSMCKSLGGNLLEFDNKDEQIDVLTYLIGDKYLRGEGLF
uniref:C-type lectin domain-containing protein n=1 Tax=Schizaphis graminum TaxID=13262 RepID=A0A2S2P306_SCHGA